MRVFFIGRVGLVTELSAWRVRVQWTFPPHVMVTP